jgi:hypothetical protein
VAILACCLLLPLKPRYWTPPSKRKVESTDTAGMHPAGA